MKLNKSILTTAIIATLTTGGLMSITQENEPTVQANTSSTYTLSSGETLWSASQTLGVDVYELAETNGVSIDSNGNVIGTLPNELVVPNGGNYASTVSPVQTPQVNSGLTTNEYALLARTVQQEAGGDYTNARWVMGVIYNRVQSDKFSENTIMEVLHAPNQFESVRDGHVWRSHNDIISSGVYQAIDDTLAVGSNHNYLFFQEANYAIANGQSGVNVGGNMFFSEFK